ncbi:MAG: hypothetical protein RQ842_08090 [Vulcanisaeta sp.]|jgi:hypothetical protein|nr:hypothetical protein [Vulcanisaeta sp.]
MATTIKRCPNVIEVFRQWHTDASFLSPDDRYVNDNAVQVEQYTGIPTIFEGVQAGPPQRTIPITIFNLAILN